MQLSYRVHEMEKAQGTNQAILVRINPYIRITNGNNAPLFIQKGCVFSAGGQQEDMDKVPGWFWDELEGITEKALTECGFSPEIRAKRKAEIAAKKAPKVAAVKKTKKKTTRNKRRTASVAAEGGENGND